MNDKAERKPIPTWAYKGDDAKLFDHPDDIPKGWTDSPAPKSKPSAEKPGDDS